MDHLHRAAVSPVTQRLYPEYLSTVEGLSGRSVRLGTQAAISTEEGDGTSVAMSAQEAQGRIPGMATEGRSFHWVEEVSLDPRDLCAALPLAVAAAGVVLEEGTEVLSVRSQADSVAIATSKGTMTAGAFVNCSGAWAAGIQHPGLQRQPAAGVEPWKGQIFTVRVEPPSDLAYVLRSPEVYLVPRGGGNIVVGATVERVGFDRRVDPLTVRRLQAQAAELWPPIALAPVVESWTGLRPGTSDGLPVIGSAGEPRCWVATGHFRNGILLAPATGLIVRQLLQDSRPPVGIEAFARRTPV